MMKQLKVSLLKLTRIEENISDNQKIIKQSFLETSSDPF